MARTGNEEFFRRVNPARIAILKPSALGDVVQALPLLPVLRTRFPGSRITWIVQRELRELVTEHPSLDDVLCMDRRPSWQALLPLLGELRQRRIEMLFDLQGLLRSAVLSYASGARWRIGLETAREGSALAANVIIPNTGREVPAHARYWRVAEVLGLGQQPRQAWLTVPMADLCQAQAWVADLPRPLFAVQWGAQWLTKRWPLQAFADLLTRAGRTWGGSVVVVGGRGEQQECAWLAEQLNTVVGGPRTLNLAGKTSIKQLAAVLSTVDAVISNDSGPLHLAAELGRPTLGIFTCTSPERSGPPGDQHQRVSTELACAASYRKVCPHLGSRHMACHQELTVERVWAGLRRLVQQHELHQFSQRAAA